MDHFTAHAMMAIASATMTIKAVMVGKNNMKKVYYFWVSITIDVDECFYDYDNCEHHCNNLDGSFQCYCEEGCELKNDSFSCQGILCDNTS